MWIETFPAPAVRVDDPGRALQAFQLRPDLVDEFLAWSGGERLLVNGGPAVLLPGRGSPAARIVGLGDWAVRDRDRLVAEPAAGFWNRHQAAAS